MNVRKRRVVSLVLAVLMFVLNVPVYADNGFSDVTPNHWAYEKITDFVNKGYVKGYEDNTFKPDNFVTRAEFIYMINNYYGFTGNEDKIADFPDVNQNEWYAKGINEAFARGYIGGYEDGTFRPNTIISRQEALLIIARILDIADDEMPEDSENYLSQYADYKDIANWAKKAVYNCLIKGIIKGYGDGTLRINEPAKRAEAICLFYTPEEKIIVEEEKKEEEKKTTGGGSGGGSRPRPTTTPSTSPSPSVEPSESPEVTETPSPSVEPSESPEITPTPTPEEECACGECLNELVKVLEDIAKAHLDLLVNELKEANGNTEELKEVIEKWLKEEIDNSEYKDQIYELIDELQKIDYEAEAQKVLEKIEEIIYSDMIQDIVSKFEEKIDEKISEEDKVKIKELVNSLKNETGISAEKIEELINEVIENHDCEEVEALVNKIINFLNNIESMEDLFNKVNDYLEGKISKEDIKDFIEKIAEELDLTAEELKEKIEDFIDEEKAEAKEAIEKIIEEIEKEKEEIEQIVNALIQELEDKIPTGAELEALKNQIRDEVKALVKAGKTEIEEIKDAVKAKLNEIFSEENLEKLWNILLEEAKNKISENLPTAEEIKEISNKLDEVMDDIVNGLETNLDEIETLTGIDFSKIAEELGIDVGAIKNFMEDEEVQELVKNEIVNAIANALSDNDEVKAVLATIYSETGIDVVDVLLYLDEVDSTDIIAKIVLSNTTLSDVLATIDAKKADDTILETEVEAVIEISVDYYGLINFIKSVDARVPTEVDDETKAEVKKVLTIALENASVENIAKLILDKDAINILLKYFSTAELTEMLGSSVADSLLGTVTVFYNANGGDGEANITSKHYKYIIGNDSSKIKGNNTFSREGYDFEGWNTKKDGTGTNYIPGEQINSSIFLEDESFAGTLYAIWEIIDYTVKGYSSNLNDNEVRPNKTIANIGEKITLTVYEAEWYEFESLTVETEEEENVDLTTKEVGKEYTFIMPASNVVVNAEFTSNLGNEYEIKTNINEEQGKISLEKANAGGTVKFEVEAKPGYELDLVTVVKKEDNSEVTYTKNEQDIYSFTMPDSDVEIFATFIAIDYTIGVEINATDEANKEDVIYGEVTYVIKDKENKTTSNVNVGNKVTVTVEPTDGYALTELKVVKVIGEEEVDYKTITDTKTFEMPANNVKIKATFGLAEYEIANITATNCSVWVVPSIDEVINSISKEDAIKIAAQAANGEYGLLKEYLDRFVKDEGAKVKYTSELNIIYLASEDYEFSSANVKNGNEFVTLTDDKLLRVVPYKKFTMPAGDVKIAVKYEQVVFAIDTECDGGIVNIDSKAEKDTMVTFTVTSSYEVDKVTLDGEELTPNNGEYSFKMPANKVLIKVSLIKIEGKYGVTASSNDESKGTIKVSDVNGGTYSSTLTVEAGKTVYVETVCKTYSIPFFGEKSYKLKSISITDTDGNTIVDENGEELKVENNQFTMPECDVKITAKFDAL